MVAPADTPDPLAVRAGDLLAGKYRVEKLLGSGGMGSVFLAENIDIGRKVAIKILHGGYASDPDSAARFRNEARAAATIGHPNIIDVLDVCLTDDGKPFIVMERLEGETLGDRIHRLGRIEVNEALAVLEQVLDALAAAHDKGIVHRDLKPDNVFLTKRAGDHVKLLDFGISKFSTTDGNVSMTQTGEVMGTPLYMSPEQARGSREVGPATDIYAAGVMLYEALSGRPPFNGTSYNEVIAKVLMDAPTPLPTLRPDVPARVASAVSAMLSKSPADRPATAKAAIDLLRGASAAVRDPELALSTARRREDAAKVATAETPAAVGSVSATDRTVRESGPPRAVVLEQRRRVLPIVLLAVGAPLIAVIAIVIALILIAHGRDLSTAAQLRVDPKSGTVSVGVGDEKNKPAAKSSTSLTPTVTPLVQPPVVDKAPPVRAAKTVEKHHHSPPPPQPQPQRAPATAAVPSKSGKAKSGPLIEPKNPYED